MALRWLTCRAKYGWEHGRCLSQGRYRDSSGTCSQENTYNKGRGSEIDVDLLGILPKLVHELDELRSLLFGETMG